MVDGTKNNDTFYKKLLVVLNYKSRKKRQFITNQLWTGMMNKWLETDSKYLKDQINIYSVVIKFTFSYLIWNIIIFKKKDNGDSIPYAFLKIDNQIDKS